MLHADLALYDRNGQLVALVDVKNKIGTNSEWAADLRRNLLSLGEFGPVVYFLVVTPERVYLWKDGGNQSASLMPDYEIEAHSFLAPYIQHARIPPGGVGGAAFELAVGSWLADLMRGHDRGSERSARERLQESGLIDAASNGRVEYDLAA